MPTLNQEDYTAQKCYFDEDTKRRKKRPIITFNKKTFNDLFNSHQIYEKTIHVVIVLSTLTLLMEINCIHQNENVIFEKLFKSHK